MARPDIYLSVYIFSSGKYQPLAVNLRNKLSNVSTEAAHVHVRKNPRTSSTKYCRPIKFEFVQETKAVVLLELGGIKQQIEQLTCTTIENNDDLIHIHHELECTMVTAKFVNTPPTHLLRACAQFAKQARKI